MADLRLFWPCDTSLVTEWPGGFSDIRYGVHMGTDFGLPQGTPLRATVEGSIRIYNGIKDGWGIDINRADGLVVRNWHISEFRVSNGDRVKPGDIIGLTGGAKGHPGAGNSTGAHLHWEIRTNTNFSQTGWLDPRPLNPIYFDQAQPQPEPEKEVEDMAIGAFFRVADGANRGGIYWQEKPNLPFIAINEVETWDAYAANGNKFNNVSGATMEALKGKYGMRDKPNA